MEFIRIILVCALSCIIFLNFICCNQESATTVLRALQNGVVEPRHRHRLQLLFPLLLQISTRLATLVSTALTGLFGIILFVAFSKKALIVSLFALFLIISGKLKSKDDDIYIHKVNSYPDYNDEQHILYHHHGPPKYKVQYYGKNHPYNTIRQLPPPVDFCKMSLFERQRVKDTWLSIPKSYQTPAVHTPTSVRRTPFGLSVPALKAKCSPHTELLAAARNPLPQMHYITKSEREMQKELEENMTKEELKWLHKKYFVPTPTGVKKAALRAKITPRIEAMSLAKLCVLKSTKQNFFLKLNPQQRNSLQRNINEHFNNFISNYPPEADKIYVIAGGVMVHSTCSGRLPDTRKKVRYICELTKNQRRAFRRRMKLLGLPKKTFLPDKGPDRGPKKKLKQFEPWITVMSQPRYNVLNEIQYNPFKVKSSAQLYNPTERILILAKPRRIPPPPPLTDFEGNELPPRREWSWNSRRRIIATPRTVELATPRFVKKKAADDVKEDPFAVPRRALTAFCSARTIELAEPKRR